MIRSTSNARIGMVLALTGLAVAASPSTAVALEATPSPAPAAAPPVPVTDVAPVPHPALDAMEPAVRAQLDRARRHLDQLLAAGAGGDSLGVAFGDLGELYLVYDLGAAAAACLDNAARLQPGEARWPHLLGTLYEHDRRLDDARRWYQQARAIDPSYLPARLRLGKVLVLGGDAALAREALEGVLATASATPTLAAAAEAWLGRLWLREKDPRSAIAHLERALELQPSASALRYPLAQAYRAIGETERARAHFDLRGDRDVEFSDPIALEARSRATGVGAELALARAALRAGDLEGAEAAMRRAVALDPASPLAHRYLGELLGRSGRWEEAARSLVEAVRLDPEDVSQRMALADVFQILGRDREVVEVLSAALAVAPSFVPARRRLGAALVRLGEDDAALAELEAALRLDPDDVESRAMLARALGRRGRFVEAAAHQARVVELDPGSVDAHVVLATARLLGSDFRGAVAGLEAALVRHPNEPRLMDALAKVLAAAPSAELRDGARALDLASRLYSAAPSLETAETLALALAEVGRFDEAAALEALAVEERVKRGPSAQAETERARGWLERYRRGEPVREPWRD
jgi:tetratricopeptide (TPR) repeat protein